MGLKARVWACGVMFVLAGALGLAGSLWAQATDGALVVNTVLLEERTGAQRLSVYFTLLDADGFIVTDGDAPRDLGLVLGTNPPRSFAVGDARRPTEPLYLTLVIDVSGSAERAMPQIREAAALAVAAAPPNTYVSIVTFYTTVTVVQPFTQDRNEALLAINGLQAVRQGYTCLFDGAYRGVTTVQQAPASARKAVVLFTDGVNDAGPNAACTFDEVAPVVAPARQGGERVPVFTIGQRGGQGLDEANLQRVADETGGLYFPGTLAELGQAFTSVMSALAAQWVAVVDVCLDVADVTVPLTLTGNTQQGLLQPGSSFVRFDNRCLVPTETPTRVSPTPIPLLLFTETTSFSAASELITFEVRRTGTGDPAQYRVQLYDAETNNLLREALVDATGSLVQALSVPTDGLRNGPVVIRISALDAGGVVLRNAEPVQLLVSRPTPTPTTTPTPSATLAPLALQIRNMDYDASTQEMVVALLLRGQQRIVNMDVDVINEGTGQLAAFFPSVVPEPQLRLDASALVPLQTYIVRLVAEVDTGELLLAEAQYRHQPPMSATPSPSPTITPTPTLTPTPTVLAAIDGVSQDGATFLVAVAPQNPAPIVEYELRLITEGGQQVAQQTFAPPEDNRLTVAMDALASGRYTVRLRALNATGGVLSSVDYAVVYDAPLIEGPGGPGTRWERLRAAFQTNPGLLYALIGLIGLFMVLLVLLIVLLRRRNTSSTVALPLPERTGIYEGGSPALGNGNPLGPRPALGGPAAPARPALPNRGGTGPLRQRTPAPDNVITDVASQSLISGMALPRPPRPTGGGAGKRPSDDEATIIEDEGAFNQLPEGLVAALLVERSPVSLPQREYTIGTRYFAIGRRTDNNMVIADSRISRHHATVLYQDDGFYVRNETHENHLFVDGKPVLPAAIEALPDGATLQLSPQTTLRFEVRPGGTPRGQS